MKTKQAQDMVLAIAEKEIANRDTLCELDSMVGDGDHGFTVEKGFKAVKDTISGQTYETIGQLFEATGQALQESMGGAIGLIIGSFFTGGAASFMDKQEIDAADLGKLFSDGLEEIQLVGNAEEGDRTLVDALAPASRAYTAAAAAGDSIVECLEKAAAAADQGAKETANMIARQGRARFLREKSLGHVDAGATTMKFLVEAMYEFVSK